ncbi:hypothetical protein SLA2020_204100 [Shorea laevis]
MVPAIHASCAMVQARDETPDPITAIMIYVHLLSIISLPNHENISLEESTKYIPTLYMVTGFLASLSIWECAMQLEQNFLQFGKA